MPTRKELEAEVDNLRKQLAEAVSPQQLDDSAATSTEPPTWIQQFLTAQSESQRQMQQLMGQLVQRASTTESHTEERQSSSNRTREVDLPRRPKADAQKPPILDVGISLAEFAKWRKAYNDYVVVAQAQELPQRSQLALLRTFFSMDMREAVEHVLLIPDETELSAEALLDKIKEYVRSQRNIALDCVAFEERKQAIGESFDAFLIAIKTLARDADLCDSCMDRRLVTKIMSGIRDKETG